MRLAVLLSGRGSNFESILRAIDEGRLSAEVALVASNNPEAKGLATAASKNIPTAVFDRQAFDDGGKFAQFMLDTFARYEVDILILAGYLRKIPPRVIDAYEGRILNIHPALLPRHGGKGMYGLKVHQAVLDAGETETGVTIHLVQREYDQGPIVTQEYVPVLPGDTAEILAARVLKVEHATYPRAIQEYILKMKNLMLNSEKYIPVKRALLSCWRKEPAVALAQTLNRLGVVILSSGSTAEALKKAGIPATPLEELTGFDNLLGGRVKTLHPKIHAAILARPNSPEDAAELERLDLQPVDLVAVDLYPFPESVDLPELPVELIDIGGVALIRAAAKNFARVAVAADAEAFPALEAALEQGQGSLSLKTRYDFASWAFKHTSTYDARIQAAFSKLRWK